MKEKLFLMIPGKERLLHLFGLSMTHKNRDPDKYWLTTVKYDRADKINTMLTSGEYFTMSAF